MKQKVYLCFDIGATTTKIGYINPTNLEMIHRNVFNTREVDQDFQVQHLIENLEKEVRICKEHYSIIAVGISTAGGVNMKTGTISYANHTMNGYVGTNWKRLLKTKFNLKAVVVNDVKAAGMSEFNNRSHKSGVMVTLGTGFSAALFVNGQLYPGINYCAGEVGQMVWPFDPSLTVDSACSAVEATKKIKEILHDQSFKLTDTAKIIHVKEALAIRQQWMKNIVYILQVLNYFYDPEIFIIGGGVSRHKELVGQIIELLPADFKPVEIAKYSNDAALYGLIHAFKNS